MLTLTFALTLIAADVWTDPFPGIRYLYRSTDEPKRIHALVIDLSRPEISIRTTKNNEKGRTTSSFANLVGAAVAVNGDFYNTNGTYDPVGLAIGEGTSWSDDPGGHRFIACTVMNACEIDTTNQARAADPSWNSAVGGNTLLVNNGNVVQSTADDTSCGDFCTTQHPRTAVGLSADRLTMILVVVEGRQTPILGMTTHRLAQLMHELGSDVAINLDGGGSSAMVVDGMRVSGRPSNEPSERSVSNHLAIIFDETRATTGRLVGFVRENDLYDTEAGLAGARVALSTGETRMTDERGFYEFAEVPPGDVTVDVTLDGFLPVQEIKAVTAGITNWKSVALIRGTVTPPLPDAGAGDAASGENDAAVSPNPPMLPPDAGVIAERPEPDPTISHDVTIAEEDRGCTCTTPPSDASWLVFLAAALFTLGTRRRGARAPSGASAARGGLRG